MKKLFSGVQPSGNFHIGNYAGAIKQWLSLQNEYESIFFIADLHAITIPKDPEELRAKTLEIAKVYLAAGLDPEKCTLFVQSQVPEHAELCWILNTVARMGDLDKMTQFKDKSQKEGETTSIGLYDYPVLQAADILLYDAELVPVGEDQLQHVELTRTLARRFNERFGETFVVPEAKIVKEGARIMGLDDSSKKMSKSAASEYNYISLVDNPETVVRKIKKAVTDSGTEIVYRDDKPALKNLLNIYSLFSNQPVETIVQKYQGKQYGEFKTDLAEVVNTFLAPFQERLKNITDEQVLAVLETGRKKASERAKQKMKMVREKIGLLS